MYYSIEKKFGRDVVLYNLERKEFVKRKEGTRFASATEAANVIDALGLKCVTVGEVRKPYEYGRKEAAIIEIRRLLGGDVITFGNDVKHPTYQFPQNHRKVIITANGFNDKGALTTAGTFPYGDMPTAILELIIRRLSCERRMGRK